MKKDYLTGPRKILDDFFKNKADQKFTVKEIFEATDKKFSMSTIYRNLESLEKQGFLKRFVGTERGTAFQITSDTCKQFLHMTCKVCGKTFHVFPIVAQSLETILLKDQSFCLDKAQTTLVGVCKDCQN